MSEQDDIRADLDVELFAYIGKPVTFIKKSLPIYNTRGETESITNTTSTVTIVPYNITQYELTQQPFGNLPEGTMFAAVRYDVNVALEDQFTIEGENWRVIRVEPNYLPDNVATIVALVRNQP